jgi:hypothetical protein
VDIEQGKAGEAYVLAKNAGKRVIPTIEFADGGILVELSTECLDNMPGFAQGIEGARFADQLRQQGELLTVIPGSDNSK